MKNSIKKSALIAFAAFVAATSSVVAPGAAHAAPQAQVTTSSIAGRTIQLNYCWSSTTFRSGCPRASLTLNVNGLVGANAGMPGSSWIETPTTLTLDFINPNSQITRTVYEGTRTSSTTQICYAGTMTSTRNLQPSTMTGVWQGCIA